MSDAQPGAKPLMVVTGGSRGIGRAIVDEALAAGYRVAVIDVDARALAAMTEDIGSPDVFTANVDITDVAAVESWVSSLVTDAGVPAALVNNAGIVRMTRLEDVSIEDWRAVVDVNLTGTFVVTQRVGRRMIANGGGSIVSIGSIASQAWTVGGAGYPPTKAGIAMLMQGAAIEWGPHGIRANTVSPGYTQTPMTSPIFADPVSGGPRLARVALGRIAQPSEIADVVLYLCSPQASYLTGQNIVVDGGVTISSLLAPLPANRAVQPVRGGRSGAADQGVSGKNPRARREGRGHADVTGVSSLVGVRHGRVEVDNVVRHAGQDLPEHPAADGPAQVRPGAAVYADAEGHVPVRPAVNIDLVRVGEAAALEGLGGREVAEEFLDRAINQVRLVNKPLPHVRMLVEPDE